MNGRAISIVYGKELRGSLRDRRTIISMIVVPVLAIPLLMFGTGILMAKAMIHAREEVPKVMIVGGENSPKMLSVLHAAKSIQIVPTTGDFTNQLIEKRIRAVVKLPPDIDSTIASEGKTGIEIFLNQGDVRSVFTVEKLNAFFQNLSDTTVRERLKNRSVPVDVLNPFTVRQQNVAPASHVAGSLLGGMFPYILITMCLIGAMYPAIDVTAGEKERGTMETVLCCPVERINLVLGKFLMVLTASICTVVLSLLSMGVTFQIAKRVLANSVPPAALQMISNIDLVGLAGVLAMLLPTAVMLSALMLMLGLFSKSFREAQSYAGPLMMVAILPTIVAIVPGVELNARLVMVPLVNICLACKEMMAGTWHWNYLLLIFASACLYAAAALAATVWMFHREEVLFRS